MFVKAIELFLSSLLLTLMILPVVVPYEDKIPYYIALAFATAVTLLDAFMFNFGIQPLISLLAIWSLIGGVIAFIPAVVIVDRIKENQKSDLRTISAVVSISGITSGLICVIFDMIKQAAR